MYLRLIAVFVIVLFLSGTHWKAYLSGKAQVQLEWDADSAKRIAAALEQEQAARAKEAEWATKLKETTRVADSKIAKARSANAAAVDVGQRLREQISSFSACSNTTTSPAISASASSATGSAASLLADVQRRLDGATEQIARFADESRIAGQACERAYDSLTP